MSVADELEQLRKLHADGTITDEQYERAKAKLLEESGAPEAELASDEPREESTSAERKERDDEREEEEEREERRPRRRRERDYDDDYERRPARRLTRKQAREWCMLLHLSLLAGHVVAFGGIVAPIVIWQTKKDEIPEIDVHGKNAMNWLITWILYMIVSAVLCFVFVGIPLVIVGAVLGIVFPIIAGIKASEGIVWRYPLAIPFLR